MDSYERYVYKCILENDTKLSKSNSLVTYYKDTKGRRRGAIVAYRENNEVFIGVSLCHRTEPHGFNKDIGINKAIHAAVPITKLGPRIRTLTGGHLVCVSSAWNKIPNSLYTHVKAMVLRAYKYFKDIPGRPLNTEGEVELPSDMSEVTAPARVTITEKPTGRNETGYEFNEVFDEYGTTEVPKELEGYIRPLELEKK